MQPICEPLDDGCQGPDSSQRAKRDHPVRNRGNVSEIVVGNFVRDDECAPGVASAPLQQATGEEDIWPIGSEGHFPSSKKHDYA